MKLATVYEAIDRIVSGAVVDSEETENLEFKQDPATVPAPHTPSNSQSRLVEILVEAVICFANSEDGGVVVLGLADKAKGPAALTGTAVDQAFVRRKIFDNTKPPLPVVVHEHDHKGTRLLIIEVPAGLDLYTDSRGRAVSREGTSCKSMPEDQRRALSFHRRDPDHTARLSSRSVDSLDHTAVQQVRTLLRRLPDMRRELADLSELELLRGLSVVDDRGRLLLAGEILLSIPERDTAIHLRRESTGGEPQATRVRQPLVLALPSLLARVQDYVRPELSRLSLPGGQEIAIPDFPSIAVDEAVTNALVHRDWQQAGEVVVDHSPQILRVWSPGGFPPGVTIDRLLTTMSRPRNATLMNAVRTLGLAEATSRGFDRMYREMIRTGRDAPIVTTDDFSVEVTFTSGAPNRAFATYVFGLEDELRDNVNVLLILSRLCDRPLISVDIASELMQVKPQEGQRILDWMATSPIGILTRDVDRSDGPRWRLSTVTHAALGTAVTHRARGQEATERVTAHIQEYGWITNRTIRNMFSLDVQQARTLLAEMRDQGVIVKEPAGPSRGPGIRWLPGPSFAQSKSRRRRTQQ